MSFTPAYTVYPPMVANSPNRIVGAETDSGYTSPYTGLFEGAPFGWYRWVSANWADVQPTRTQWLWNDSAAIAGFTRAYSDGLQVIAVIRTVPDWASTHPGTPNPKCGPMASGYYTDFAVFASNVISRYMPYHVQYYELFNEPDMPAWGQGQRTVKRAVLAAGRTMPR